MPLHPDEPKPKYNPCEGCEIFKKGKFNQDIKCDLCIKNPKKPPFRKIINDIPNQNSVG